MPSQPRAIASLNVSFGLVAIPVKVFSSNVPSEHISFHLVRAKDGSRVRQQYVAVSDDRIVAHDDLTKALEVSKGKHVVFSPAELKSFEEHSTRTIEISQFVPWPTIDPLYVRTTFYLTPDKSASKPYALFTAALGHTEQCALGRWVSHGKESVVAIRSLGRGLALHQLRFHAEVRDFDQFRFEQSKVSEAELSLAEQLIKQLAAKRFEPQQFRDEHQQRVEAALRRKKGGDEFVVEEPPERGSDNVVDLMGALKASLGRGSKGGTKRGHGVHARSRSAA